MRFRELTSVSNLSLSWSRINTSTQARYKNAFRPVLNSYGLSEKKNIRNLSRRLNSEDYEPTPPLITYIAKPSGLQRPISYLCIEDQIIYQAFANEVINKLYPDKSKRDGKNVFSHWVSSRNKKFFLSDWKFGYQSLQNRIEEIYKQGKHWMATFDIASFYDSIDHEILIEYLFPKSRNSRGAQLFSKSLRIWASGRYQQSDGIPQGPTASATMAESFLASIDITMSSHYEYLRYSDDIYLFGRTEEDVRRAAVHLDVICKEKGLIPQTSKYRLKKYSSLNEIKSLLPAIESYHEDVPDDRSKSTDGIALYKKSRKKNRIEITDKTLFRYALFRAEKDRKVLNSLIRFIKRYPEHIDAIKYYIDQFEKSRPLINEIKQLIKYRYPYDYVVGELWKIVARMGTRADYQELRDDAIRTLESKGRGEYKKVGAALYLIISENKGFGRLSRLAKILNPVSLSMVAPYLDVSKRGSQTLATVALRNSIPDPGIALVYPIVFFRKSISDFLSRLGNLHPIVHNIYHEIGLIGTPPAYISNPLAALLRDMHSIGIWNGWTNLLGHDYQYALSLLRLARGVNEINPSSWITHINSFSEVVVRNFWRRVNRTLGPSLQVNLVNTRGVLTKYGVILDNIRFSRVLPLAARNLKAINDRRNTAPSAHAFEWKTGKRNQVVTKKEQLDLTRKFREAIIEVVHVYTTIFP